MELIDVSVSDVAGGREAVVVPHSRTRCRRGLEFGEVVMLRDGEGACRLARVADITFELDDTVYRFDLDVPCTLDGLNRLLSELDLAPVTELRTAVR